MQHLPDQVNRFDLLFAKGTGFRPYGYQESLACGSRRSRCHDHWLSDSTGCQSMLIEIPTGFGKTGAVVLAWIWNRVLKSRDDWPRRLVYCLPMRTLVEQTIRNTRQWLDNLGISNQVGLHVLMGGEDGGEWDIFPEQNAVLVGTQDMLLSRAFNRGYGMSRYRWPMHFGPLNNDCLWVMDEVQLMGPALWTSAQLDWMRTDRFASLKPCYTWWMSATIRPKFLQTPDRERAKLPTPRLVRLAKRDQTHEILHARRPCQLWKPPASLAKTRKRQSGGEKLAAFAQTLAEAVIDEHREGSLSLVVCNAVSVAQRIYVAVRDTYKGSSAVVLLTSRFRAMDRREHQDKLLAFEAARKRAATGDPVSVPGLICVSTQVIEAGVDISSRRLWSEIAPWASTVQRLGRLNRDGRLNGDARAWFWEGPEKPKRNAQFIGPYNVEAVELGHTLVNGLIKEWESDEKVSGRDALVRLSAQNGMSDLVEKALTPPPEPCPRAIDVHGLFSTEPDVFGGFTDVSPFVRNQDENADVTVFWRDWRSDAELRRSENLTGPAFARDDGCTVAIGRLRGFLEKGNAWIWIQNMDMERAFALHRIFNGRRYPVPTAALMTELECSRSTLHRAICHLRDSLGAPVSNEPGRGYFYDRKAGKFELPGLWFRADELEALLVMDQLIENVQPGVLHGQIDPLRDKIKELLDHGVRGCESFPTHRIRILRSHARQVAPAKFVPVASAVVERRRLAFAYAGRVRGETTRRTASPQRLVYCWDQWYLEVWDEGRDGLRTFSIDRMADIEVLACGARERKLVRMNWMLCSRLATDCSRVRRSARRVCVSRRSGRGGSPTKPGTRTRPGISCPTDGTS